MAQFAADLYFGWPVNKYGYKPFCIGSQAAIVIGLALFACAPWIAPGHEMIVLAIATVIFSAAAGLLEVLLSPITKTIQVPAGQVVSEQLICGDNAKGIVAGWEYDQELVQLGNDPQPKTRVFKTWNPTSHPLNATLYLLCLEGRTGTSTSGEYVNTATVTSSSVQDPGAVLSDDATVNVEAASTPSAPDTSGGSDSTEAGPSVLAARLSGRTLAVQLTGAGSGSLKVTASSKFKIGNRHFRKGTRLAGGTFSVADGTVTARVKLSKTALKAIRAGKVKSVRVSVSTGGKTVSKNLRVQRG